MLLKRESVNPACFEARALLKRELECCSDRPETVNCQPGLFGRGMFREATQAIRCGVVSQWYGKFQDRHLLLLSLLLLLWLSSPISLPPAGDVGRAGGELTLNPRLVP